MRLLKALEKNWLNLLILSATIGIITVILKQSSNANKAESVPTVDEVEEQPTAPQLLNESEDEGEPEMPFHEHVRPEDLEIMRGASLSNNIEAAQGDGPSAFEPDCDSAPL